ncbi:MFS transporter [Salinisphaera aquimarina]|uniref:MFS transporter n=1 Tax=Salinisphaera aquimarina TaxID=2094031 RepID=A0ABV7EU17_9GAMM
MTRSRTTTHHDPSITDDGARASWALAVAQLVSWGSVYYSFSLLVVPMEQTMGWPRTTTNGALSLGLLISGLAAYPIGTWIDRGHGRTVMLAGSVLAAAMLALWSQAHSLWVLFVVWAGLGVALAAVLYDPVFAIVTRAYPTTFRRKITLITLVGGFASTVFIPLTQGLTEVFGWRGCLLSLAAVNIVVCVPIHFWAIRPPAASSAHDQASQKAQARSATALALRTPTFWALAVCFTAYYTTLATLTFHLVPLLIERQVAIGWVLTIMGAIGPAQVAARGLWFALGRRARPAVIGLAVTGAFPIAIVILLYAGTSSFSLLMFALIFGGANGMMTILRGTIVQDVMWTEGYGSISGLLSVPSNIAKGIAPISAAALWAVQQHYALVEWTVLAVSLVSFAAFVVAMRCAVRT